jgi:LmbE family N-acetylglucosaminyl deacetylase
MAKYAAGGAHVTLVTCTRGEEGEVLVPGLSHLASSDQDKLGLHRESELALAMKELGITDFRFLGSPSVKFRDSGMMGTEPNNRADVFWQADIDTAAKYLVEVIEEIKPQIMITYDEIGGYGHPDHIQAHRIAMRASEIADWKIQKIYWNTMPKSVLWEMVDETMRACASCHADLGIMFDTDADRAGFVLPRVVREDGTKSAYEPLNRNRLIALLGVIFGASSPGCTIVTDSTTSEGLSAFLEDKLGLSHLRYLRGYANVIGKARELTESGSANAEIAIETSGHCAMRENGYVDDGTYTAVKIIGLLARTVSSGDGNLLDLISDLEELPFDEEFRIKVTDGSLATTTSIFERVNRSLTEMCERVDDWSLDEENLEGVRVRLSSGGFFMIRQSLHDPVMSMQVESISKEEAREKVLMPLLELLSQHESLDYSALV